MLKKIYHLLIIILLVSCHNKNNYTIKGNIKNLKDSTEIYLFNYKSMTIIDTCYSKNNKFSFIGNNTTPIPAGISYNIGKKVYNLDFWLENDSFAINTLGNNPSVIITGGYTNKIKQQYDSIIKPFIDKKKSAYSLLKEKKISNDEFKKHSSLIIQKTLDFCYENPNNLFSQNEILIRVGELSKKQISKYYNLLNSKYKNTEEGILLKAHIQSNKIKENNPFIEIEALTINDKQVKLSDYKGSVILLDFWASWCPPCIKKIEKDFPVIQKKYPDLKIISFSFDFNKQLWINKSQELKINWLNISNLKQIKESITAINYNINQIPTSFLIDKNGTVIKRIEFEDDLLTEVSHLFK